MELSDWVAMIFEPLLAVGVPLASEIQILKWQVAVGSWELVLVGISSNVHRRIEILIRRKIPSPKPDSNLCPFLLKSQSLNHPFMASLVENCAVQERNFGREEK